MRYVKHLHSLSQGAILSQLFTTRVSIRPNKKIPEFRVTRPYLNLLMTPRIFSGFLEKKIILCILKGLFKVYKIIFFSRKKLLKNYVCAYPTKNFQTRYPKQTNLGFSLKLEITLNILGRPQVIFGKPTLGWVKCNFVIMHL